MKKQPLPIFPSEPPLSPRWEKWFHEQGYEPVLYNPENPQEITLLLLFTPVRCAGLWLGIEDVWSHYFLKRNLTTRLIQAGIKGHESRPNYLHLYHLPPDFTTFLEDCKTVSEDWMPVATGLTELSGRIRLFFDGHGSDGFWHWLAEVRRFLNFLPIKGPDMSLENTRELLQNPVKQNQFKILKNRWDHYKAVFTCLPDQRFVTEVNELLENLQFERLTQADDLGLSKEILQSIELVNRIAEKLEPLQSSILPTTTLAIYAEDQI